MLDPVTSSSAPLSPIVDPYLLCLNVTCYRDSSGRRYFDPLWERDLREHVRYLANLTLASPCRVGEPPPDAIACDPPLHGIRFVDLPAATTRTQALLHLPAIAARLWREIGRSRIVHLGVAGWPIPFGWTAGPIAVLRRKPFLVIVESAPWRLHPGMRATPGKRWWARLSELCAKWCVHRARLVIVTQEDYSKTLLSRDPSEAHVIPASWLNDADLISDCDAAESWRAKKLLRGQRLKLLFAGRLVPAKGVPLLLDAMRRLHRENAPIELDILGEGELLAECASLAREMNGAARVNPIGTLPYGEKFFRALRPYHAVVVPSLSDEQPRIVYDAFSQAVPVLASRTPGLQACVEEERTGAFAAAFDGDAWADLFRRSLHRTGELERMGMAGLETARAMTLRKMHERRWRLLLMMIQNGKETFR